MSTTYTTNTNLQKPALADVGWSVPLNADFDQLDAVSAIGTLAVAQTEVPSASLNVKVSAGTYYKANGVLNTYAGTASIAMTASQTNYVYLTDAGVLTVNTTGFSTLVNSVPLAKVVTGLTTITTVTDQRLGVESNGITNYLLLAGGTFADTIGVVVVETGTTNGVRFGGSVGSKVGFWGVAPVVQPLGAAQAVLINSTGGTVSTTLAAVTATNSSDQSGPVNANFASLFTQTNAIRTALVAAGIIKGSA